MKTKLLLLFFILHLAQLNAQNSKELLLSSAGKSVCECLKEKSEVNYLDLFPCITNFANNSSDEIYKVYQDKGEHFIDTFVVHAVLHTYDHCPAIVQQAIIEIYVSFVALQVCECLKKSGSVLDKTSLDRQNCISDAKLAGQPQLEIILRDQENKEEFLANLEKELQASFKENCPGFFTTIEYDKNDREELWAGVIIQRANSQGEAIIAAENLEEFLKNNPEDWEVAYILMQTLFDYTDLNDKVVKLGE